MSSCACSGGILTRKSGILSVIFDSYVFADYYTRDMLDPLPETIKPQSLVDTGGHVSGIVALSKMKRLTASLASDTETVEAQLDFGRDAQGIRFVRGSIKGKLPLTCQRCMETVYYPVEHAVSLGMIIREEQVDKLPDVYDPLLIDSPTLSLTALIEDELLLALPIVALHADDDCSVSITASDFSETEAAPEKPHPFAALAELKGKLDSTR